MNGRICTKGKSCGATCIQRSKWCIIELGPQISKSLEKTRKNLGVMKLFHEAKKHGGKGFHRRFNEIKGDIERDLAHGKALKAKPHLLELQKRLRDKGLIPKHETRKDNDLGSVFARGTSGEKKNSLLERAKERQSSDKKETAPAPEKSPTVSKKPEPPKTSAKKDDDVTELVRKQHQDMFGVKIDTEQAKRFANARREDERNMASQEKKAEIKEDIAKILKGESKAPNGSLTTIAKDMGVGTKTAKAIAKSERDKLQPQKGQITRLESALGLGTLTRKEVGRDRSALIEEAKNLKANKLSEYDKLEKLENKLKREQGRPEEIQSVKDKREKLWNEILEVNAAIKGPQVAGTTGNTRWAREDAKDFDFDLTKNKLTREGDKKFFGWDDSYGSGAKKLGEGSYGAVIQNKDGTVIKRGDVSNTEASIIKKLEGKDIAPKLIAADINGRGTHSSEAVDIRRGRIAMGLVPGEPMGDRRPGEKVNGVSIADAYWKARAGLHREGVAHNDMHIENVLIDNKGKGRFVDMGLAQASPKAALAEALGAFGYNRVGTPAHQPGVREEGDFQVKRYKGTAAHLIDRVESARTPEKRLEAMQELAKVSPIAARVTSNRDRAIKQLRNIGLDNNEIATIMDHGIRNRMTTYGKGPWAKLSDEQAQSVINTLYAGI